MRSRFAILLAIAVVCVTTAWAAWTPEALIKNDANLYSNNGRKAVFGPDGIGHLVYAGIGCSRYDPLSGWSAPYQVCASGGAPSVALDADGTTIHVAWDDAALGYRKCVRGANGSDEWGPVTSLYSRQRAWDVGVACVPGEPGHVVVCWWEQFRAGGGRGSPLVEAIGFIECVNGVWGTPIRLDSAQGKGRRCPSIAAAPNGDVFIAYFASDDNPSGSQIYVTARHNGVWGATVDVTPGPGSDCRLFPAIETNPSNGNPHVVFYWYLVTQVSKKVKDWTSAAYHVYRNSQGTWQTPERVSGLRHGMDGVDMYAPTMAIGSAGEAYATWCEYFKAESHGVRYSYCPTEGGAWIAPAWLTSDTLANYMDEFPHVVVDEYAQTVRVFWDRVQNFVGPFDIWSRSSSLGDGGMGRPVALSQSGIELFPNPTKAGRVTVQYAQPYAGPMTVTLLDVSGRAVKTREVAAIGLKGSFNLDASGLNRGVYVLKLESGATSQTRKLVIE
jgi:hypothetical protein